MQEKMKKISQENENLVHTNTLKKKDALVFFKYCLFLFFETKTYKRF